MGQQIIVEDGKLEPVSDIEEPGITEPLEQGEGAIKSAEEIFNPKQETEEQSSQQEQGGTPAPKYRFSTLDDYEKSYTESEKRMYEATRETAELKKQAAINQKILQNILAKQTELEGQQVDKLTEIEQRLTDEVRSIDFDTDPSAGYAKFGSVLLKNLNELNKETYTETKNRESSSESAHKTLQARFKAALGIVDDKRTEQLYQKTFLPAMDKMWQQPGFRHLSDDDQFGMIIDEVKGLMELFAAQPQQADESRKAAIKEGAGMGRGGTIPMKRSNEETDSPDIGSMAEDMKLMRQARAVKSEAFR